MKIQFNDPILPIATRLIGSALTHFSGQALHWHLIYDSYEHHSLYNRHREKMTERYDLLNAFSVQGCEEWKEVMRSSTPTVQFQARLPIYLPRHCSNG